MYLHANAKLGLAGRLALVRAVEDGCSLKADAVTRFFVDHLDVHRPHRALNLKPPDPAPRKLRVTHSSTALVERRDRLGGLLHEYRVAA